MTALTQAIRQKGYWRIRIRPADYVAERIEYSNLAPILDRTRVSLRGWDLPPRNRTLSDVLHGNNWIGGDDQSTLRPQAWRFHQSGQLALLRAIWTDHIEPQEGLNRLSRQYPVGAAPVLPVGDTVFTFTEAFEFASRLAMTDAGADPMILEFDLVGLQGRILWVDDPNRSSMDNQYQFHMPELSIRQSVARSALAGEAWDLAVESALQVYSRFGWNPPRQLVEGQQAILRRA